MIVEILLAFQAVTCGNCSIHARVAVKIGDVDGPGIVSLPTGIARTRNGNWVITHQMEAGKVNLFSPTGAFLKSVGRRGEGPGEYRYASLARVGPGDSIWIFDNSLMRVSVLDSALRYGRSFPVATPSVTNLAVLQDGRLIVSSLFRTEGRAGYPLHVIETTGTVALSFGTDNPVYRYDREFLTTRRFWPADAESIWTADVLQYRVQLWSLSGKKLKEFVRRVNWFPPQEDFWYPRPLTARPHPPGLVAVQQDSTGVLWTLVRVPDPAWKSALGERPSRLGGTSVGVVNREKYWDTIVEALNPETGKVLASYRLDAVLYGFVADRIAFQYVEDAIGNPSIIMWQFQLVPSTSGGKQ